MRNAYGRQLGSFKKQSQFSNSDFGNRNNLYNIPMTFIRAPFIESVEKNVEILALVDNRIVAARQNNQLEIAFHPELTDNTIVHTYFLDMVNKYSVQLY